MKNWDYANLSKAAKAAGGPEALLKLVKDSANEAGINQGRKEGAIVTGLAAVVAFAGYKGYKLLRKFFTKKEKYPKEVVEKAEQELIKGINEYDESQQDMNCTEQ